MKLSSLFEISPERRAMIESMEDQQLASPGQFKIMMGGLALALTVGIGVATYEAFDSSNEDSCQSDTSLQDASDC